MARAKAWPVAEPASLFMGCGGLRLEAWTEALHGPAFAHPAKLRPRPPALKPLALVSTVNNRLPLLAPAANLIV